MVLNDGQELCIDGKWYRGGDFVPFEVDPTPTITIDNNDVKIETESETPKTRRK